MSRAYSVEELAQRWGVDPADVEAEVARGELRAFVVNGKRRIAPEAVARFEGQAVAAAAPAGGQAPEDSPVFVTSAPFRHRWPNGMEEAYAHAFEGRLVRGGATIYVRMGVGMRQTVGRERRRIVVFLAERPMGGDGRPAGRPVAEFVGTDDYQESGLVASLIKTAEGKEVRATAALPPGYAGFEIVPYSSVVTGPYSHSGLAIVLRDDDRAGMTRHALLRAQSMGLLR